METEYVNWGAFMEAFGYGITGKPAVAALHAERRAGLSDWDWPAFAVPAGDEALCLVGARESLMVAREEELRRLTAEKYARPSEGI